MTRKTKRNIIFFTVFAISVLFFIYADLNAQTTTTGGERVGVMVRETFEIHQDRFPIANNLHFKVWQKEDWIEINGWHINISHFSDSLSARGNQPPGYEPDNGQHAVDVDVWGTDVPFCNWVEIEVIFWLTHWNTIRKHGVEWSLNLQRIEAIPAYAWEVDYPVLNSMKSGGYIHKLTFTNDDLDDSFIITELSYLTTMDYYKDLKQIDFSSCPKVAAFNLNPGDSHTIIINTSAPYYDGHIYFNYKMKSKDKIVVDNATADHVILPPLTQ
jgi:hypothetical protein